MGRVARGAGDASDWLGAVGYGLRVMGGWRETAGAQGVEDEARFMGVEQSLQFCTEVCAAMVRRVSGTKFTVLRGVWTRVGGVILAKRTEFGRGRHAAAEARRLRKMGGRGAAPRRAKSRKNVFIFDLTRFGTI
jgi:hypothetical protein